MKKIFTSMFALATLLTANAQMASGVQARVYAYDLQQEQSLLDDGVNTYAITFKTNCAANEGKVILLQDGEPVYEVAATSTDGKNWTAKVDVYALQEAGFTPEAGTYNWSVEVSANPVTDFQMISGNANSSNFAFYRSYGVAVDKNPENDNFGRVYVVNQYNKNSSGSVSSTTGALVNRKTEIGIYTFAPNLDAQNNASAYACDIIGDVSAGDSPKDIVVGEDGLIYAAVATKSNKIGVYTIDPSNEFSYQRLLDGSVDTEGTPATDKTEAVKPTYYTLDSNGNVIVGLPFAVGVYGSGEDREVYVINGQSEYSIYINRLCRYKIGLETSWSSKPSYNNFAYNYQTTKNVRLYHEYCAIEPIKTGGYWIAQYATKGGVNSGNYGAPSLMYANKNNAVEFTIEHDIANGSETARNGALAVHEDNGVVAFSDGTNARFIKYSVNDDNTITVDNDSYTSHTMINQGSYSNSFDFDYAGNLYSATSSGTSTVKGEMMAVFAVPDAIMGENKRVTPAKSSLAIELTDQDITTGIVEMGVDTDAAVEYYNLQGVKVANPSNGIFIKKQGNKTTKVVL